MLEFTAADEKRLYRKVAWRLIPFLLACYTIAIIDRFNISFAKLQFLHDLAMNDEAFGWAAGMCAVSAVNSLRNSIPQWVNVGRRKGTIFGTAIQSWHRTWQCRGYAG